MEKKGAAGLGWMAGFGLGRFWVFWVLGFAFFISKLFKFLIQTRFEFKYKFEFNHTQTIKVCTSMNASKFKTYDKF